MASKEVYTNRFYQEKRFFKLASYPLVPIALFLTWFYDSVESSVANIMSPLYFWFAWTGIGFFACCSVGLWIMYEMSDPKQYLQYHMKQALTREIENLPLEEVEWLYDDFLLKKRIQEKKEKEKKET